MNNQDFFSETFRLFNTNKRTFEYRLKRSLFSQIELKLLKAYQLFRKKQPTKALELLKKKPTSEHVFLLGFHHYLKALIQNYQSKYRLAYNNTIKANDFWSITESDLISSSYLLSAVVAVNRKEFNDVAKYLDLIRVLPSPSEYVDFTILQLEAIYHKQTGNIAKSKHIVKAALKKFKKKDIQTVFLLIALETSIKEKDYKKAYEWFDIYKKNSGFKIKTNYIFIQNLLDNLTKDIPIYVYKKDFRDFPEFWSQLNVIKNLYLGEIETASDYWQELTNNNNKLYQAGFEYSGEINLFQLCLDKYKEEHEFISTCTFSKEEFSMINSPVDKCYYILKSTSRTIRIEDLIKLIWSMDVSESTITRLRSTIYNCKKKYGCNIKSQQESYQLVDTSTNSQDKKAS
jgi:hypothetical protein